MPCAYVFPKIVAWCDICYSCVIDTSIKSCVGDVFLIIINVFKVSSISMTLALIDAVLELTNIEEHICRMVKIRYVIV